MKKIYFVFSFWPLFAFGQVYYDFESGLHGDWEQFPLNRWESSPEQSLSGSYSLHHSFDNTTSGTDRISVETGYFDVNSKISWEFKLRHGYTSSSSNKWCAYLASETGAQDSGESKPLNAYVIGVNLSGSDDTLRLYEIRSGELYKICSSSVNFEKDIGTSLFHCKISRDSLGVWTIYGGKDSEALNPIGFSGERRPGLPKMKYFMISYSYTSSKDRLFWFDDLRINAGFLIDTIPPVISAYKVQGKNSILLEVSEDLKPGSLVKEQVTLLPGNIFPEKLVYEGINIKCYFTEDFSQKSQYHLLVSGLMDLEGNVSLKDSIEFTYYKAEKNDIVITEIMADPAPPVYLPDREYIELFNRSEFTLALDSFVIITGLREWTLPAYEFLPGDYLVIMKELDDSFNCLPIFTSSSVISNDGQKIYLKDKYGEVITASEFYPDWNSDEFKSQGGWSLERIDNDNLCGGKENWKNSEDVSGGTPGRKNSVWGEFHDFVPPGIDRLEYIGENRIRLIYSENIDPLSVPPPSDFTLIPANLSVDSVISPEFFCSYSEIVLDGKLQKGEYYTLNIPDGIKDCEGNPLENINSLRFGLPSSPGITDIIISELLISSLPGCTEFIELHNRSNQLFDLSDIRISVSQNGESANPGTALSRPVLFFPGEYLALCRSKDVLLNCNEIINQASIIECGELPSLPDNGACVRLFNRSLEALDIFCYAPEDQFPMLSDVHGISLERLVMDINTGDQSAWHSSSSVSGFGTPGAINSQSLDENTNPGIIYVTPKIFSPDNNGFDDFLEVHYSLEKDGFVGTVAVFDPFGRVIQFLGENEILGTSGVFIWDGRNDKGLVCRTGLYMIYAEFWNLKGEKKKFKKGVVLVRE